jgi:hypothetical protein
MPSQPPVFAGQSRVLLLYPGRHETCKIVIVLGFGEGFVFLLERVGVRRHHLKGLLSLICEEARAVGVKGDRDRVRIREAAGRRVELVLVEPPSVPLDARG